MKNSIFVLEKGTGRLLRTFIFATQPDEDILSIDPLPDGRFLTLLARFPSGRPVRTLDIAFDVAVHSPEGFLIQRGLLEKIKTQISPEFLGHPALAPRFIQGGKLLLYTPDRPLVVNLEPFIAGIGSRRPTDRR